MGRTGVSRDGCEWPKQIWWDISIQEAGVPIAEEMKQIPNTESSPEMESIRHESVYKHQQNYRNREWK
jgi:hypothetical protein